MSHNKIRHSMVLMSLATMIVCNFLPNSTSESLALTVALPLSSVALLWHIAEDIVAWNRAKE